MQWWKWDGYSMKTNITPHHMYHRAVIEKTSGFCLLLNWYNRAGLEILKLHAVCWYWTLIAYFPLEIMNLQNANCLNPKAHLKLLKLLAHYYRNFMLWISCILGLGLPRAVNLLFVHTNWFYNENNGCELVCLAGSSCIEGFRPLSFCTSIWH